MKILKLIKEIICFPLYKCQEWKAKRKNKKEMKKKLKNSKFIYK